jgi:hypothetical protein
VTHWVSLERWAPYIDCLAAKQPILVIESRLHSSVQSTLAKALITHFLNWTNIFLLVGSIQTTLSKLTLGQIDTSARQLWFHLREVLP